jgi:hypothetical protein
MSHLVPENPDGSRKDPSTYSREEKAHIARQVLDSQRDNRHYGNRDVDRDALIKAKLYAAEAGDDTTAGECTAALAALPSRGKA